MVALSAPFSFPTIDCKQMRKQQTYLIEKATGLRDENDVELFYTFAIRLSMAAATRDYELELKTGAVRIRKLIATN